MNEQLKKNLLATGIFTFIGFALTALYAKFVFLRLPKRNIPNSSSVFVSPANGKIIGIRQFDFSKMNPELKGTASVTEFKNSTAESVFPGAIKILTADVADRGYIISIALDITNVHYQRAPIASVVIAQNYKEGSFKNALRYSDENFVRIENEHNSILMASITGIKYKVVQIAGLLARRIESYVLPGSSPAQGEVIGVINLGSQVTMVLPSTVAINCAEGDTVIDGETILATIANLL